jgi:hypothetical protein
MSSIFETKREEVTGEWRELRIEELHDVYSSPSHIRIMKARTMRCRTTGGEEERV